LKFGRIRAKIGRIPRKQGYFMGLQDKKLAVLHQLGQETQSIGLQRLLANLGTGYAERSVRRWLAELHAEGLVEKIGNKRNTRYKVILRSCFGLESAHTIEQVRRPLYERSPVAYNDHWFETYQPDSTFYIPIDLRSQLHRAGKRASAADPAGTYAHQIFNRLLIDLSYNSSRLEGNTYSLLDTQRLVLEGRGAEGKLDEEKIMILNHKEAIRYLVDSMPRLQITLQTICTLHYLLAEGLVEARYAGKIRDYGVRVGGSTYIPFEDKKQLQIRFEHIIKKASLIKDPYEQSLFLLVHISYLQAFVDVNKRTARLCANISLVKNNLVPLSFNDIDRDDYNSAMLAVYELQDIRPILDLYLFSYMRTCVMYDATVKSIGLDEIRVRYRQQRRVIIREIILNKLVGKSMQEYIREQTEKIINKSEQAAFLEDVLEDLKEIDENRIAGLGITTDQLKIWKVLCLKNTTNL